MKINLHNRQSVEQLALFILIIVALVLAGYVAYQYKLLSANLKLIEAENLQLNTELEKSKLSNRNLFEETINQQAVIDSFSGQIQSISSTVGTLEKLSQTDPELLNKYSKVYFLNENYVPAKLTQIEEDYIFNINSGNLLIHTDVWPFLKKLLDDAQENDAELLVVSAFRSFDTQATLKSGYNVTYGAGTANQFSADQGYSEHQLGTSVDLTTQNVGATFSNFQKSSAYEWLKRNAYKYGFIISYPEGNSYYKFEPWHWRFVGVELATILHKDGKYFYDLDQREIDTYLVKLFD